MNGAGVTGTFSTSRVRQLPPQRVPTPFAIQLRDTVPPRGCTIPGWNDRAGLIFRYSLAGAIAKNVHQPRRYGCCLTPPKLSVELANSGAECPAMKLRIRGNSIRVR